MTPTIVGTQGRDDLSGTEGVDVIAALGGNDDVWAGPGDVVCGGGGDDFISRAKKVLGGRGSDDILGSPGPQMFRGGGGRDHVLLQYGGYDVVRGGRGRDTISVNLPDGRTQEEPLVIDLLRGKVSSSTQDGTVSNFENARGCSWAAPSIVLRGTGEPNVLHTACTEHGVIRGREGDDRLVGHYFADQLYGGTGKDTLISGGAGDDDSEVLAGGAGFDIAFFRRNVGGHVEASLATGSAQIFFPGTTLEGEVRLSGIEGLTGTGGDDRLTGDGGANSLVGLGGDDYLNGREGTDSLDGGAGSDTCVNGETTSRCEA